MKVDLRARRTPIVEMRCPVLEKAEQEKGVTWRESAVKWRRRGIVAGGFVVESCARCHGTGNVFWS